MFVGPLHRRARISSSTAGRRSFCQRRTLIPGDVIFKGRCRVGLGTTRLDFTIAVPDEKSGAAVAEAARGGGYEAKVDFDPDARAWTCYCTKRMVPAYDTIVSAQAELETLSAPLGGHCDGWGTFGD